MGQMYIGSGAFEEMPGSVAMQKSLGSWRSNGVDTWDNSFAGDQLLEKAFTTGSGIVTANATGGQALRTQFLHKTLEYVSFAQNDARMMKIIPKGRVRNNTIEWTQFNQYGSAGDGFVGESGATGVFDVGSEDDTFTRLVQTVHYMGVQRTVSLVSTMVQNIEDPMKVETEGATLSLIGKLNLNLYDANSLFNVLAFNGLRAQIQQWVVSNSTDYGILYDAGGQPVDKDMLEDIRRINSLKYGDGSLLMMSVTNFADTQRTLFPEARFEEGTTSLKFGNNKRDFLTPFGEVKLDYDKMLRIGQPVVPDGVGSDGAPRTTTTADTGSLAFAATPFVSCAAGTAGTGSFYVFAQNNTDSAATTSPAVPTGLDGNQGNRLAAGNYYYGISTVYQGKESACWVYGTASAGIITSATAIAPTAGQTVKSVFDCATPCITGLGTTYAFNQVKFRVYRYGGPGAAAPTALSQFQFLGESGIPVGAGTVNSTYYDNGYSVPGTGTAYLVTERKNNQNAWFLAQLLPMMRRILPHLALADLFALLVFVTPILWVPRHHMVIRNIGRIA